MNSDRTEMCREGRPHLRHRDSPSLEGREEGGTPRGHRPEPSRAEPDEIQPVWWAPDCADMISQTSQFLGYCQDLEAKYWSISLLDCKGILESYSTAVFLNFSPQEPLTSKF